MVKDKGRRQEIEMWKRGISESGVILRRVVGVKFSEVQVM
jgi:hypothetical protein